MESNIIGNYNYNQFIIKRDCKNEGKIKIIIPKKKQQQRKLNSTQCFHQAGNNFRLTPQQTLLIQQTPNISTQIYRPSMKYNKKISKNFSVELMENILPWTYLSNSLREAAKEGNLKLVIELIKNGADLNEADRFGI